MSFSQADRLKFKIYCQEIINKPRAIDDQPHVRMGGFIWCEDWKIIEILKYYFIGTDTYLVEAPPKRLKRNPLWKKDEIVLEASDLRIKLETAEKIIEHFREVRNASRV